jgi:NADH dehydrogenase
VPVAVVTGAFSYTGAFVARELQQRGYRVRTLTNRARPPSDWASSIESAELDFGAPDSLERTLSGAALLVNTYWIRYPARGLTFARAVDNTATLLASARRAGVGRVVHVSVSNPERGRELAYFAGKLACEELLAKSRLSYAVVRPTLVFGLGDILLNDIAWCLRHAPLFTLPGNGGYRLQPVSARDVARIVADAAHEPDPLVRDAAGPEIMTFRALVEAVAAAVECRARIRTAPPWLALGLARLASVPFRDRMLVGEEVRGLEAELLLSSQPPLGTERLGDWLDQVGDRLGRSYHSEIARHFRRGASRRRPVASE